MPTVWENSYVDRLQTLSARKAKLQEVVEDVRSAIEPLLLPDAAKVLTAIATDIMSGVQKRNDRADVNEACAALQRAIISLEAVGPNLDG
jgi:hypothetical protein